MINQRIVCRLTLLALTSLFVEVSHAQLALRWYHQTPANEHHIFREITLSQSERSFYTSDLELDRILQFENSALPSPIASRGDPSWQSWVGPYGIDLASDGWLYVAVWEDQAEHALWRLREEGSQISRLCDLPEPPRGIHVTGDATDTIVYVSGNYGSVIRCRQNLQGKFEAEVLFKTGITMNQQDVLNSTMNDVIYVSSWSDHYGWTPYTSPVTKWDLHGNRDEDFSVSYLPRGNVPAMAIDPTDNMLYLLHLGFAANDRNARIYKVDPVSGAPLSFLLVGPGGTNGGGGIEVSSQGEVYFAMALGTIDGFNVSAFGKVSTVISSKLIRVPADFATIQAAIDAASPGDTVLVSPGLYAERLTISKEILLCSEAGAKATTIDASGLGENRQSWVIDVTADCAISGFTLTSSDPYTFGVFCRSGSPFIGENIITGVSYSGVGSLGASPVIDHNLITNCAQVGIILNSSATPQIVNNTIVSNGTGIAGYVNSNVVVTNNIVVNNRYGGLQANSGATMSNSYNDVWGQPYNYVGEVQAGRGEISVDPRFVGGAPFDYHLQAGSPCIDAGDPDSPNDTDGSRADLGAYPFARANRIVFGETPEANYAEVTFDAHMREISYAQMRNYGATDNIRVLGENPLYQEWKGLLKFDFRPGLLAEGVTQAADIARATLRLRLSESEGTKPDTLWLYRIMRDWGEGSHDNENADAGEVTWQCAKQEQQNWEAPGATGASDCGSVPEGVALIRNIVGEWYQIDVTNSVRRMFSENQNCGWLLKLEAGAGMRYFNSKECVTPEFRPTLLVELAPTAPIIGSEITFGEFGAANFSGVTHDAHIREIAFAQHRNYGATDNVRVLGAKDKHKEWKGLLRFDFLPGLQTLGVQDSVRILSAKVRLHLSATEGTKIDNLYFYNLYKVWNEGEHDNATAAQGEVTWNNAQAGVLPWSLPGAYDREHDCSYAPILTQAIGNRPNTWHEFDVTEAVKAMLVSGENNGWLLELEAGAGMRYFNSKEALNAELRPRLLVTISGAVKTSAFKAQESLGNSPNRYALEQNYPNPFNPSTEIRFALPQAQHVVVKIFNTLGEEIRTLADAPFEAGYHRLQWDGRAGNGNPVASGVYLFRIEAGEFVQVKKMSLVR